MNLGLDPTQVDWNDPSVEYLLKYFKMTMTDRGIIYLSKLGTAVKFPKILLYMRDRRVA